MRISDESLKMYCALPEKSTIKNLALDLQDARTEIAKRLGPSHPFKEGCYCSPCRIEKLEKENRTLRMILDGAYS